MRKEPLFVYECCNKRGKKIEKSKMIKGGRIRVASSCPSDVPDVKEGGHF